MHIRSKSLQFKMRDKNDFPTRHFFAIGQWCVVPYGDFGVDSVVIGRLLEQI